MTEPYRLKGREVFWDDFLTDTDKTTAPLKLHESVRREMVICHDEPWEGDCCDYHNFFRDDNGLYRMYYLGWKFAGDGIVVCYAESEDGIHWVKPKLGICEYGGSYDNNIILDGPGWDNFMVMRDPNESEGSDELYKAVAANRISEENSAIALWCYTSPDAIHFKKDRILTTAGMFDTLNVVLWDDVSKQYYAYVRGFHKIEGTSGAINYDVDVRDIRVMTSPDFKTWTEPVLIDFCGGDDCPLYTNVAQKYYRAESMFIGFPTRYIERRAWNSSFERLTGRERRQWRMTFSQRYGLTVTDCVFMSSRDGFRWNRTDEAFLRPGPEEPNNWVYGDCYPTRGLVETPGSYPGTDNEISFFTFTNHWSGTPAKLWRNTIRLDGFRSRHAGYEEKLIVTKPFIYDGDVMRINFSTSALGYLYITLRDEDGRELSSGELFGDKTDRIVDFDNGEVSELKGHSVVMEIRIRDADIYSFVFE